MTKTVLEKLGLKVGQGGYTMNRPASVKDAIPLPDLPGDAVSAQFLVAFVENAEAIRHIAPKAAKTYAAGGHLWMAYPKKSGPIKTDIARDHGWKPMEEQGLLPVTQVAIDDTWSALRWRRRDEIKKLTRTFSST